MANIDLLPAYVTDWFWNYGWASTLERVKLQQAGADSADAFNYYSSVIATMNAIDGQSVPAPLVFGAAATRRYSYTLATPVRLGAAARVGSLQGRSTVGLRASGRLSWLQGRAAVRFRATGRAT